MTDVTKTNGKWNVPTVVCQLQPYGRGEIPRVWAEEAYKEYVAQFGNCQSFERLHERGGFGLEELAMFLFQRIERLKNEGSGG